MRALFWVGTFFFSVDSMREMDESSFRHCEFYAFFRQLPLLITFKTCNFKDQTFSMETAKSIDTQNEKISFSKNPFLVHAIHVNRYKKIHAHPRSHQLVLVRV